MSPGFRNVLLISGVLKVALALVFADLPARYDETEFLAYGRAIAEEGAPPALWRAPGYQWVVAAGWSLAGGRPVGVRLLQVVLSVAATLLAYRIARRAWGERAGFWAGTFLAFYPSHVALSHLLWSETLYLFLVLAAADRLLVADESGSARAAVAAGILLGAASLTRSLGVVLLGASLVWILRGTGRRRKLATAVTVLAAAVVVILPWSVFASRRAGRLVLVDVNGGFNLWSGNNEYIPAQTQGIWAVGLPLEADMGSRMYAFLPDSIWREEVRYRMSRDGVASPTGADGEEWYRAQAWREIRRRPGAALARVPLKLAALWAPDFFLPRHLVRDWYGPVPPALAAVLLALTWLAAAGPLVAGPAALAAMRPGRFRSLALLWILAYLALHAVAYGHSRMHQPLVPLLVMAGAAFLFDRDDPPRWRLLLRRGAPWAGLVLAGWVCIYPTLVGLYLMPSRRHSGLGSVLAAGRHLPLPAARRLDWLVAGAKFAAGDREAGGRILEESPARDHPWTLFLRGWMAEDPARAAVLLARAVKRDPGHFPALEILGWLRGEAGDRAGREECVTRAIRARPWREAWIRAERLPSRPREWLHRGPG